MINFIAVLVMLFSFSSLTADISEMRWKSPLEFNAWLLKQFADGGCKKIKKLSEQVKSFAIMNDITVMNNDEKLKKLVEVCDKGEVMVSNIENAIETVKKEYAEFMEAKKKVDEFKDWLLNAITKYGKKPIIALENDWKKPQEINETTAEKNLLITKTILQLKTDK